MRRHDLAAEIYHMKEPQNGLGRILRDIVCWGRSGHRIGRAGTALAQSDDAEALNKSAHELRRVSPPVANVVSLCVAVASASQGLKSVAARCSLATFELTF